jgi:hypothetical protein
MSYITKQNDDGSTSWQNTNTGTEDFKISNTGVISSNGNTMPASISFSAAAGGSNVAEVTITVKDGAGNAIAAVHNLDVWLSDAATGAGLTATTASGAVAAKTSSGTDLGTLTTKKALRVQTLATGVYTLSITDTAKTGFYVCASLPGTGKAKVSSQLVTGNYG